MGCRRGPTSGEQPAPEKKPITITLPDGNTKEGVAFGDTAPLTIALGISKRTGGKDVLC